MEVRVKACNYHDGG